MWGRGSRFISYTTLVICWLIAYPSSYGQYERDLQIQQQELTQKIEQSNQYLAAVRESKDATLQELQVIKQNTADRIELVEILEAERIELDQEIELICADIDSINAIKDSLNLEYYTILAANYKRQLLVTPIHLLFSNESIHGLLTDNVHADQYKYYIDKKKSEYEDVEKLSNTLLSSYEVAIKKNAEKQERLKTEKLIIDKQLIDQEALVKKLQLQESQLKSQLQEAQNYRDNIDQRIALFIQGDKASVRHQSDVTTAVSRPTPSSKKTTTTSVEKQIPVKGTIVGKFGRHRHPTLPDVYVVNNGIDIAVYKEQPVYAVSGGKIMTIESIKDGSLVLIDDGSIYHVYSPIRNLAVGVGQTIVRGQEIGIVTSELHLEIWDGKRKINPEDYLKQ